MSSSELQETYDRLVEELVTLDRHAMVAVAGLGEAELTFDVEACEAKKRNVNAKLPFAEVKLLQQQLPELKTIYKNTKRDLNILELGELPAAAKDYDEKSKALDDARQRHGLLQLQAYGLQQTILETVEKIAAKRRRLKELISEITSPDGAVGPTDNRLIRN